MLSVKLNYTLSGMQMSCDTTSFHMKGSLLTLTAQYSLLSIGLIAISLFLTWLHLNMAFTFNVSFPTTCPYLNHLSVKLVNLLNDLNLSGIEDTAVRHLKSSKTLTLKLFVFF